MEDRLEEAGAGAGRPVLEMAVEEVEVVKSWLIVKVKPSGIAHGFHVSERESRG